MKNKDLMPDLQIFYKNPEKLMAREREIRSQMFFEMGMQAVSCLKNFFKFFVPIRNAWEDDPCKIKSDPIEPFNIITIDNLTPRIHFPQGVLKIPLPIDSQDRNSCRFAVSDDPHRYQPLLFVQM